MEPIGAQETVTEGNKTWIEDDNGTMRICHDCAHGSKLSDDIIGPNKLIETQ